MDEEFEKEVRAIVADLDPGDVPAYDNGIEAFELARAMFVVLARDRGEQFAAKVRDEIDRRANEMAESGHPWEPKIAQLLLDMPLWDVWLEIGISGDPGESGSG